MTEQHDHESCAGELPPSLNGLILTLTATALAYLGQPVNPDGNNPEPDFHLARYTIDTIQMLKEKTEGNRTNEETELIDDVLTQLRLIYIQKTGPGT